MYDLFNALSEMFNPSDKLYELSAIWLLDTPIMTGDGYMRVRLEPGMTVPLKDGKLMQTGEATHKIIGCHGTLSSSELYFVLTDLKTNEPLNLKVK
jgi:hypothetical protein